jgi:hypothetical protein
MNDWTPLETQLRSWTPRRPSAELRTRLFGGAAAIDAAAPGQGQGQGRESGPGLTGSVLGWLAPATAVVLLAFVTLNPRQADLSGVASSRQAPIVAVTFSNISFAAYLPGSFVNDQNTVPPATFEWTNRGRSPSSMPSFPQARTNDLKH